MGGDFSTLLHSSLSCAGADQVRSVLMYFAADTLAHIGIAGIVSSLILLRGWWLGLFWVGLALIISKELLFDLPNAAWAGLVWFDSAWDLASWFAGFFVQWWAFSAPVKERQGHGFS